MKALLTLAALLLTGCATTYQCERQAMQAEYGSDPMENILIHDDAIRECRGEPRRGQP